MCFHTNSAVAGLSFARPGAATAVGSVRFSSVPDSVTITAGLTAPGTITSGLAIAASRIQYDIINSDQGPMYTWTVHYPAVLGPSIIGAYTPLGYLTSVGTITPQGGFAYTTLFNAGYGVYNYNTAAPWIIDYEPDHITFATAAAPPGLPMNDGEGFLNPTPYLPSFAILFDPALAVGLVPADVTVGSANMSGQVLGPLPGNTCLSIQCSNLVLQTCSNCFLVTAATFSATAIDTCCSNVVLQYQPPVGTCLPLDSTNTVVVVATDSCGNAATNFFTVTVIPGPTCLPTNCISINASDITVYTCNPCTPAVFNVTATDNCCPGGVSLTYNPPVTTCFPQNSTTPVTVTATDQCGNSATTTFFVTVLPGPTCGNTNCIAIYSSNIVAYTCSNCTKVAFTAFAFDPCCSNQVSLFYYPSTNTCFPLNTTTPVQIVAKDNCGNSATNYITVTVLPGANCNPTNCISIYASNIVAYTCSSCTNVSYNTFAVDTCCPGAGVTLVFNPPETTCFPQNSTTPVTVTAIDQCGNSNTATFTVTVLPAAGCNPTNCISIYASNIVAYTCSSCTNVSYNTFAVDTCCPGAGATLVFNPPETTCFPQNSTTPVTVTAIDQCGNSNTATFTVTVLPAAGCTPTNCISIYASNIVAYTCSNCTTVPFNGFAFDSCCSNKVFLIYNPPTNTCFPLNSSTPVAVVAYDLCGNSVTNFIIVTVLPGPNCGGASPGPTMTGLGGPGGSGTNYITIWWPATNAQLQQSLDLNHWASIPGATNSPYVVPPSLPMSFYRLQYH